MQKTVLITGASSGIGRATAEHLLAVGYRVYASARNLESLNQLKSKGAVVLELDVTQDDSMRAAIAQIIHDRGYLDILINNAGYGSYGALEDVPLSEAKRQFEVNVFGLARLTQLVLPHMRSHSSGTIVNITSIGGKIYEPLGSWYHASKFAVEGLSDCLRLELQPFGIDVIVIEPGPIKTAWGNTAIRQLMAISGQTAYAVAAQTSANLLALSNDEKVASDPSVIAKTIAKALQSKRPKARYAAGTGAKLILFVRKMVNDAVMDRVMRLMAKQAVSRGAK